MGQFAVEAGVSPSTALPNHDEDFWAEGWAPDACSMAFEGRALITVYCGLTQSLAQGPATATNLLRRVDWLDLAGTVAHEVAHAGLGVTGWVAVDEGRSLRT